ncbi:MAG TPA: hypothetical protein VK625_16155 [Flavitalea sp.]|nr:hypothetical protein [Flavitalea sp.]
MFEANSPSCELSSSQFSSLIHDLASKRNGVSIRLQFRGEQWLEHFASVLVFSKEAILLTHMPTRTVINVPDLNKVTGFEIDQPFNAFLPFQRYTIKLQNQEGEIPNDGLLYA